MEIIEGKAEIIGHLGLVAATIQDLGIMEKVDDLLGAVKNQGLSYGYRVGSMMLNGLGFVNTALYIDTTAYFGLIEHQFQTT